MIYRMRKDKNLAFELRKKGKSYRELEGELGVSRSTLSEWFRNIEWSKHIERRNIQSNTAVSKQRIEAMNAGRKEKLRLKYREIEIKAEQEFKIFKSEPLFMAGLMIYAGEGDKVSRNLP